MSIKTILSTFAGTIVGCLIMTEVNKRRRIKKERHMIICACEVQRIVNDLRRDKRPDERLEESCRKLWDLM